MNLLLSVTSPAIGFFSSFFTASFFASETNRYIASGLVLPLFLFFCGKAADILVRLYLEKKKK